MVYFQGRTVKLPGGFPTPPNKKIHQPWTKTGAKIDEEISPAKALELAMAPLPNAPGGVLQDHLKAFRCRILTPPPSKKSVVKPLYFCWGGGGMVGSSLSGQNWCSFMENRQ